MRADYIRQYPGDRRVYVPIHPGCGDFKRGIIVMWHLLWARLAVPGGDRGGPRVAHKIKRTDEDYFDREAA